MDEITGHDIDDIERYCKDLREGHTDSKSFRKNVLESMGYSPEIVKHEQELLEIAELW